MPEQVTYAWIPFSGKSDDSQRLVEGYVSSADIDLDQQIVDPAWLKSELPTWLSSWGNIREQHRPDSAVGRAQAVDLTSTPGPHLSAHIVDDQAWAKVKAGVYNGFSVGIKQPRVVYDGSAKNGRINGGKLIEISIVDRPANDAARFTLVKRAGRNEWKLGAAGPVIEDSAKAAATTDSEKCVIAGCDCDCTPTSADPTCTCVCPMCTDARMDKAATVTAAKAVWTTAEQNDLPDSSFAFIEAGGEKDNDGKTTPRDRRHFPYKDADGKLDEAHVRNALVRIPQSTLPQEAKDAATRKVRAAATTLGIGETDGKEKTVNTETQAPTPDAGKAAASHIEHKHPFKGVHNHEHDDQRGGTHIHAHLHDDDDIHDHTHLDGKDARMLTPEQQTGALKLRQADSYFAATADATKAASDVDALNPTPGSPVRPARIGGDLMALLKDVSAQLERLADQTDKDRDGDADNAANMAAGDKRTAGDFQQLMQSPSEASPEKLSLTFASEADLVKFIDTRITARGAVDFVTKAAAAEPLGAIPDIAKLAGGIAKGLEALAGQTKATQDELVATKAALSAAQTDIAQIKEMATPPKGSVFAIDKGIGFDPDRINPDGTSKSAVAAPGSVEWLAGRVAGLSAKEREELAVKAYTQFHPNNR